MPEFTGIWLIPIISILSLRFLMSNVFQLDNPNADNLLKGLLQGTLMYQAFLSTNQQITIAFALAIVGRLVQDFLIQQDIWKVISTTIGFAFGVLLADVVSYIYNDEEWSIFTVFDEYTATRKESRSHRNPVRRRVSEPRRIEDIPSLHEEVSSIDSQSHLGDQVLPDIEKEIARLRAKALYAAGQSRKCREERKWALSQGNLARAFQLRWQIKKYHALAMSFTREADQQLIENDRAKRGASSPIEDMGGSLVQAERQSPGPFVQVVVENGQDHDRAHNPQVRGSKLSEYFVERPSRGTNVHDISRYKSENRSFYTVSGAGNRRTVTADNHRGPESPPTSDTWSRQLD